MANNVTIGINVNDGGSVADLNKQVLKLKRNLQDVADIASKVHIPSPVLAAREGVSRSQPVAATYRAAAAQPGGGASDTNLSRGIGGQTGASGRDFAAQAQGLGGLVHLYATFAANLYAVSAAYGALSKAADTTNMVKGLDQLGASSGRSLGSLAKQMVAVADGAISMREAIQSTALTSAGGMSNANILRMTEVAKKASLALGRDMPDSMDRLTKGIVKIQPELLDELGIMTRVIPAQEAYARSVGKTAASLTDYEKRQAFANAVLDEGERKFNAIKLDAKPYSKILASMTNLLQTGLELVNKVFTPILNILSSSPAALTTAMAAVGVVLLKQAMPALGYFKENLEASANAAQKIANERSIAAKSAQKAELETTRAHVENLADVKVAAADRAQKKLNAIAAASGFKPGKATQEILSKSAQDVTTEDYKKIETIAQGLETKGKPLLAKSYRDLSVAIQDSAAAETTYGKVVDENTIKLQARASAATTAGQTQVLADRANLAAASRSISSIAAQTAAVNGFSAAWKETRAAVKSAMAGPKTELVNIDTGKIDEFGKKIIQAESITTPKMGLLRGGWTLLTAGISGATAAVGTFLNFAGPWIAIIGLAVTAFSALSDYLTKNAREMDEFTKSLDTGTDAIRLAADVMDRFNKLPPNTAMTSQDIIARSNAMGNLTDAIESQIKKYEKALDAAGNWDKVKDKFWSSFGVGAGDKLADTIKAEVVKAISLLDSEDTKTLAIDKLSKILNVKPDLKSIEEAISKLGKQGIDGANGLSKLTAGLSEIGKKSKETANVLETLKTTTEALTRANSDYNNSGINKTEQQKFGEAIIAQSLALGAALKDPIANLVVLNDLFKDSRNLAGFNPEQVESIVKYKDELNSLVARQTDYNKALEGLKTKRDALEKLPSPVALAVTKPIEDGKPKSFWQAKDEKIAKTYAAADEAKSDRSYEIKETKNLINRISTDRTKVMADEADLLAKLNANNNLIIESYRKGSALMDASINNAIVKANVSIGLAKLEGLEGPDIERKRTALRQEEIQGRLGLIQAVLGNTIATISNSVALEKSKAQKTLETFPALSSPTSRGIPSEETRKAQAPGLAAQDTINQLGDVADILNNIASGKTGYKDLNKIIDDAVAAGRYEMSTQLMAVKSAMASAEAQKIAVRGESAIVGIQGGKAEASARIAASGRMNSINQEGLAIEKQRLALQNEFSGLYSESLLDAQRKIELDALDLKQTGSLISLKAQIAAYETKSGEGYESKVAELAAIEKQQKIEKDIVRVRQAGASALAKAEDLSLKFKQKNELKKLDEDLISAQISGEKERLSIADSLGQVDKEFLARQNMSLSLDQQQIINSQSLVAVEDARLEALKKVEAQKAADIKQFNAIQTSTTAEETRINDLYNKRYNTQTLIGKITLDNLTTSGLAAEKQAQMNKLLETQNDLVSNLAKLFGDVGDALGQTVKGLFESAKAQDDLTKSKKLELDTLAKATKPGEEVDPKKQYDIEAKYRDLGTKQQLTSIASIAGSSKKMFGEKTAAYKILDTVEKASTLGKLALQAKELAMEFGLIGAKNASTAATVTGAATEEASVLGTLFAKGQSAVLSALSAPFPINFVAGAAMASVVAGLIGSVGSVDTTVDMTGKTAAERQTAQGTGTVSGDDTAKSQSISNSLDILNATSVEGLSYSNKMVELLSGIKDGISGVAKGVYGVVGLRSGSQFGTQEGTSGFSFLGGLFGSSSEKQITDAGLKITGSFADVMENAGKSFKTYEDVLTTSTSSFLWFSNTSQSLNTQTKDLDSKIQDSLAKVFNNAGQLMITAGEKLGMSSVEIMDKLAKVDVSTLASLRGLKGKELDEALNSILSSMLDTASAALFSSLEAYNKFGEGMLETTMRVVDGMEKVNLAMSSVGRESVGTGLQGIAISDAMIEASGGLSNFLDNSKNFADSFLTSAERLAPKQAALNTELNRLGFASNLTKDQFKQLVLGFKVTDDASAKTFAKLQGLSGAVDELATAAEASASAFLDLEIKIYELKGSSEALNLTRQKELDAMDAALRPRQRYINALTDEIALRDKLKSAYDTTNNSLTASIKSLQDYKTALLGGTSSTLSPAEKYAQSKAIFEQTSAAAKATITTSSSATEIKARDDAVANLSKASDSFLANSKVMNASGTQYAADFAAVTNAVDVTSSALSQQQTEMQEQLGFLDKIAVATDTTAQLLSKYLAAVGVTAVAQASATASGSVAAGIPYASSGLTAGTPMANAQVSEVANLVKPVLTYASTDTKNLFNNDALVAEVKALREEVGKLREDQKEQTGHLIATTFTANARNAEAINSGNVQALNQQNWKTRSAVTID